jgi:hypothetical protein
MRTAILLAFSILLSAPVIAQTPDTTLQSELEAMHAKWFQAFDGGDGATMGQMEKDNLILVMPEGSYGRRRKPEAATNRSVTRRRSAS